MDKIYETSLSDPCKAWLKSKGCAVSAEVKSVDLLGIYTREEEEISIAIELKVKLNLELILQAVERQKIVDYVYIAVPHEYKVLESPRFKKIKLLLRRLNVGLLTVNFRSIAPYVTEIIEAKPYDFEKSRRLADKKKQALLKEFHSRITDSNDGGATKRKLMTAYREQSLLIAHYLSQEQAPMTIKALKAVGAPAKAGVILRNNHYEWFERVSTGCYRLTESGTEAVETYEDIILKIVGFSEDL
ncbi:DUF2161 family putative PD-(D/E)XK-type phosphodiesterase [Fusibacter ferrireducens]|uniref:Uncharacterized protein n=1 Tax=Fusibacter ferrireducens TaxID=2785058 RepID=A0ABR9ZQN1_9FIRM|nr:DUF2161 family putative PD-(D/E)XK-type phosphodiesterase [Fusibacter ferrireducens]MBF4692739.1 hypothetical protein [Fusibacter ferrireducens]